MPTNLLLRKNSLISEPSDAIRAKSCKYCEQFSENFFA